MGISNHLLRLIAAAVTLTLSASALAGGGPGPLSFSEKAARPEVPTEGATPRVVPASRGVVTTYPSRAAFQAAFPGLPMETFENGSATSGGFSVCNAPLSATGDAACGFAPGEIQAGISFQDNPAGPGTTNLILLGAGTSLNATQALVSNTFADAFDIVFSPPVTATGMDLHSTPAPGQGPPDIVAVQIFDANDVLIDTIPTAAASGPGDFLGISSSTPIGRISLLSTNNRAEGVDNIEFAGQPFLNIGAVTEADFCAAVPANNNTFIEPGEAVNFTIPISAVAGTFTNVNGVLSSSTMGVTITSGMGAYGTIAGGSSASANYSIQIAGTVACFSNIDLSLAITSNEGNFTFPISRSIGQTAAIQYNGLPLTIPDANPAGASSTAVVSGMPGPITGLQVRVATTHTWVGDLIYTLTSPNNTVITLLDRPGVPASGAGCSDNDVNVTFQDGQANPENTCAGPGGIWPVTLAAPVTALSTLNGQVGNGTWTLTVSDNAGQDLGTLNDWELILTPAPVGTCNVCPNDADLSITLTDTPDPVIAGSNLTYVATLTNNGPGNAQDASISLPLPGGTTLVSATPSSGGACVGTTTVDCIWTGPTAVGAANARTVTITVLVSPAQTAGLSATATGTSTTFDPTSPNTAVADTAVNVSADLSISLTDTPDPVAAGTQLTYVATLTNNGLSSAQGANISLPLPGGTSLVSATPSGSGSCTGTATVQCTWAGATAPGTAHTATIVVLVAPSTTGSLNATATAGSTSPDPSGANNTASTTTTVTTVADLLLTLTASATNVDVNEPVTFTATSLNQGPSDAQNVVVSISLTPDFRYGSHTAPGATCTSPQIGTTGVITCTWAGPTAPGATRTLEVVAFSNNRGDIEVSASTSSATSDPTPSNNSGGLVIEVGFSVEGIPTLNPAALLLLGLLVGLFGLVLVRQRD